MKNFTIGTIVAFVATAISFAVALQFGWIVEINILELFSVFFAYISTYLCVVESRWNYPLGMLSTALLCILFFQQGLLASAALNFYLPFALLYGWMRWGPDNNTKPVSWLGKDKLWFSYLAWSGAIFAAIFGVSVYMGATLPAADATIVGLTVLAQLLLDNKRAETWIIWAIVNVFAMITYAYGGLPLVAMQYVFFLGNTIYGMKMWRESMVRRALNA